MIVVVHIVAVVAGIVVEKDDGVDLVAATTGAVLIQMYVISIFGLY